VVSEQQPHLAQNGSDLSDPAVPPSSLLGSDPRQSHHPDAHASGMPPALAGQASPPSSSCSGSPHDQSFDQPPIIRNRDPLISSCLDGKLPGWWGEKSRGIPARESRSRRGCESVRRAASNFWPRFLSSASSEAIFISRGFTLLTAEGRKRGFPAWAQGRRGLARGL